MFCDGQHCLANGVGSGCSALKRMAEGSSLLVSKVVQSAKNGTAHKST